MSSLTVQLVHITAKQQGTMLQDPDRSTASYVWAPHKRLISQSKRVVGVWFALVLEEGASKFHLDFSLYAITWSRLFWLWCLLWQVLSATINFYCTIQVLKHRAATKKGSFMLLEVSSFQTTLLWESASTAIFGKITFCIPLSLHQDPAPADSLWRLCTFFS